MGRYKDDINLAVAEQRIGEFDEAMRDEVMHDHTHAMECRDCEDRLQSGIDAFQWLRRAEKLFLEADYRGLREYDDELQASVKTLYEAWLRPCAKAEAWIASLNGRGYHPDNLLEFQQVKEEVLDTIQRNDWVSLASEALEAAASRCWGEADEQPEKGGVVRTEKD